MPPIDVEHDRPDRELLDLIPRGGLVLAETSRGQGGRYAPVRRAAVRLARAVGADIVLFNRSAASFVSDPYPSGPFTADVDGPHGERPLVVGELPALGRDYLADQVREASGAGTGAMAWLPRRRGVAGLADAVARTGPHLVLLAADHGRQGLRGRLFDPSLARQANRIDAPVAVVNGAGSARLVSRGPGSDPARSRITFAGSLPLRSVRGSFRRFDVRVQLDQDQPFGGSVEAVIQAASLTTGLLPRDLHLRSRSFLDAERNPRLMFRSTSLERDGAILVVRGDLTIRGRGRPVVLWGTVHEIAGWQDGRRRVRVQASTELHWREWGISGLPFLPDRLAIALDIVGLEVRPGSGRFNARSIDPNRPARRVRVQGLAAKPA